jgi:hypothetical protein
MKAPQARKFHVPRKGWGVSDRFKVIHNAIFGMMWTILKIAEKM